MDRRHNNLNPFKMVNELEDKRKHPLNALKDQDDNNVSGTDEVMVFWRDLNKEFPHEERVVELLQPSDTEVEENDVISLEEVKYAITLQ